MTEEISVVLADDHALVRQGLRRFLEEAGDIHVLAEAANGQELLRLLEHCRPDVVVLDIHMPVMSGFEVVQHLRAMEPHLRILVLTADENEPQVLGLLQQGVDGYVLKTAHVSELIRAVREVHAGNVVLSPQVAAKVVRRTVRPAASSKAGSEPVERPTERELAVLRLAARGMTNREIGQALSISHRTVQGHLANLYGKLGVRTRTEAVTEALRLGWLELD